MQHLSTPNSKQKPFYFSPQHQNTSLTLEVLKEDLQHSTLNLKFVNREKESELIVKTFVKNKEQQNLSQAKLVSLFQTYGIGKTSLVRKFRKVYSYSNNENWRNQEWIKNLQLFELDFRFFRPSQCISNMSEEIADFVIYEYKRQFIDNNNVPTDLLEKRKAFYKELINTKNKQYIFDILNEHPLLPEGYLVFFDEVDTILHNNFNDQLKDTKWMTCKEGLDLYLSRFIELWTEVMPLLIPKKSAIIFSGHVPVHLALTENNYKGGSPSDYCLVYLSPMESSVIEIMLEQSIVKTRHSEITLLDALKLLGLNDIDQFINILIDYTGTVPRIMENSFESFLNNLNDLSTEKNICEAFEKSEQKLHDVTVTIRNNEEANLLAHLYLLHSFKITIPVQTKLYFNKRHRNFIEILPHFKVHFQVINNCVKINIPKLLKNDILKKLSKFQTAISDIRYLLLQNNSILLNSPKALELSIIDLLVEQILTFSFTKTEQVTIFGDVCNGIFKETFFSNLQLPLNFLKNILIPGFSLNSTKQCYDDEKMEFNLCPNNKSFISLLDKGIKDNQFCAAIPREANHGFDVLITLNKTTSNVLRKLLLFEMKLYEKNFSLAQLQEEINQASSFLPDYKVDEKPSLHGENLHFTLIMVVMGYSNIVNEVIEDNANKYGSLLIKGTCYLTDTMKITYTAPNIATKSWLKLKGGFEVLLLTKKGLENLLSKELYTLFYEYSQQKEELYRKMVCCNLESSLKIGYLHTPLTATTPNIGSSQMHTNLLQSIDKNYNEIPQTILTLQQIKNLNTKDLCDMLDKFLIGISLTDKQMATFQNFIVENEIDGDSFLELTEDHLKEILALGPRLNIMRFIKKYKQTG
ncbi:hypothetical protein ABK040_011008 [Willaertia magna]